MNFLNNRIIADTQALKLKLQELIIRQIPALLPVREHSRWHAEAQAIISSNNTLEAFAIIREKCDHLNYLYYFHGQDCPPSLDNIEKAKLLDPEYSGRYR